jgi:hypothetical protein
MIARTTVRIGLSVTNSPPAERSVDTSAGGLLVTGSPIRAVVRAIIGSIPLLVDY